MIAFKDENSATEKLSILIMRSGAARRAFLKLVFPCSIPRNLEGEITIHHLHPTDRGKEIDLLLERDGYAVIVECKVRDNQKVYQLEQYREYWRRTRQKDPVLVWLVQREQKLIGAEALNATTLTWNQLSTALTQAKTMAPMFESQATSDFCRDLEDASIVLRPEVTLQKCKLHKGYDPEHSVRVLTAIRDSIPNVVGRVVQMNELSPCLHVGRPKWRKLFGDGWAERVLFYLKPDTSYANRSGPFFFQGQVLLYHVNNCEPPLYRSRAVAAWIGRLAKKELMAWRNRPGKWKGRVPVSAPWEVEPPVKYVYVEESEEDARERAPFDWRDEEAAIRAGVSHLTYFLDRVDQLQSR
jgi:hypothetical protein